MDPTAEKMKKLNEELKERDERIQRLNDIRDHLSAEKRFLENSNSTLREINSNLEIDKKGLSNRNNQYRDAATRYAVWGGSGFGGGALAGLAYSLINKKQKEHKLRNAVLGGLIGGVLGLGAAEVARWKYEEPSPIDLSANLLH